MTPGKNKHLSKFRETVIVIFSLIAMGNVIILVATSNREPSSFFWGSIYSVVCGYLCYRGFAFIDKTLNLKIPWLHNPVKRLFVGLGWQVALLLVVILFMGLIIVLQLYIMFGEVNYRIIYDQSKFSVMAGLILFILGTLIGNMIYFFIEWRKAAINEERLKREALVLQFNALKNQVNPHFLFNSLSALTTMIRNDQEGAIRFVDQLAQVYRYLLEYKDQEIVDLETELTFLDSYIYLYRIRHGKNLEVIIRIREKHQVSLITYSLQMLVENAIKHNEISADRPLTIEIEQTDNGYIWVRNNLQPRTSVLPGSQLGLENISTRYKILTSREVKIIRGPGKFEVGLPLLPPLSINKPSVS
jgi:sensor histidine kinase YesM